MNHFISVWHRYYAYYPLSYDKVWIVKIFFMFRNILNVWQVENKTWSEYCIFETSIIFVSNFYCVSGFFWSNHFQRKTTPRHINLTKAKIKGVDYDSISVSFHMCEIHCVAIIAKKCHELLFVVEKKLNGNHYINGGLYSFTWFIIFDTNGKIFISYKNEK